MRSEGAKANRRSKLIISHSQVLVLFIIPFIGFSNSILRICSQAYIVIACPIDCQLTRSEGQDAISGIIEGCSTYVNVA